MKILFVNLLICEVCMKYFNIIDCSFFFVERLKFMMKYVFIGLFVVCVMVLCFLLIFREWLCELNIYRGNIVV